MIFLQISYEPCPNIGCCPAVIDINIHDRLMEIIMLLRDIQRDVDTYLPHVDCTGDVYTKLGSICNRLYLLSDAVSAQDEARRSV
jgi:hypothetical protein